MRGLDRSTMALVTLICANCRHIGAAKALRLPMLLSCSMCGDRRLIQKGFKIKNRWTEAISPTKSRDESQLTIQSRPGRRLGKNQKSGGPAVKRAAEWQ
jgi:hypothetical protein